MNKKKIIIISIIAIMIVIGVSFASWIITLTQSNSNVIGSKCFNLTLSETNPINLTGAYPITNEEGASLTPFDFTITNTCNSYASYQVNLEILNNTTLAASEVKVMLDSDTPVVLSTQTSTTTTIPNASSAYILKTGYLDPNESVTYHLRLWVKEDSTTEASANKTFSSKVTITAGYKDNVSYGERCELEYGEGSAVCEIIAQADPDNNKCLHTDSNGMITDYSATMAVNDTPIVCAMEDDYGTSYYLRGLHTDNNVKFADMCWKIIRTTGTGGIKMIYNGDVDGNGTCTTTEGTHNGFTGQTLDLSGNKLYGTSYTKSGSTYILSDKSTMNWPNNQDNIIGKYTCGNTSSSCTTLYAVIGKYTSSSAYVIKLDQSTNYAQIGTSSFNYYDNKFLSASPAHAGYMYNDVYNYLSKEMDIAGEAILSIDQAPSSNSYYYAGDTISYSSGYYYISNQDGSDIVQQNLANNYQINLVGKYTCIGTSYYDNRKVSCEYAYKVIDTTTKTNYVISELLSGGRLAIGDIKLATSYSENNGTYELVSPVTISAIDWYNNYSSYNNYYICGDYNQTTCSDLRKITRANQIYLGLNWGVSNHYYYGSSFVYDETNPTRPYTLIDTVQFWDITDSTNISSLNTHHYTCFYSTDNTCDELYFTYYFSGIHLSYIKLLGNETASDALDKMLRNSNINVNDSTIKGAVDWWYENNLLDTVNETKLEDTVFCNDRTIDDIGGWSDTGNISNGMNSYLKFNADVNKYYLKCPNKRDAFTVSDTATGNGALSYPIALLTSSELLLSGNSNARKTGFLYYTLTPCNFGDNSASGNFVSQVGTWGNIGGVAATDGVRPSISLKPGTKFVTGGDGTASNPYVVDMNS